MRLVLPFGSPHTIKREILDDVDRDIQCLARLFFARSFRDHRKLDALWIENYAGGTLLGSNPSDFHLGLWMAARVG
jgi:hypothetical protein